MLSFNLHALNLHSVRSNSDNESISSAAQPEPRPPSENRYDNRESKDDGYLHDPAYRDAHTQALAAQQVVPVAQRLIVGEEHAAKLDHQLGPLLPPRAKKNNGGSGIKSCELNSDGSLRTLQERFTLAGASDAATVQQNAQIIKQHFDLAAFKNGEKTYLFAGTRDGGISIGVEETVEELQPPIAGNPKKEHRGHPLLVRDDQGYARISGEIQWDAANQLITVINKTGRYRYLDYTREQLEQVANIIGNSLQAAKLDEVEINVVFKVRENSSRGAEFNPLQLTALDWEKLHQATHSHLLSKNQSD